MKRPRAWLHAIPSSTSSADILAAWQRTATRLFYNGTPAIKPLRDLFPNPYMPNPVWRSHFYKVVLSMLLFGLCAGHALNPIEGQPVIQDANLRWHYEDLGGS